MGAAILIDGGYLDRVLDKEFDRVRVDLGRLVVPMAGGSLVERVHYYHCLAFMSDPPTPEERARVLAQRRFFTAIGRLPRFSVRLGVLARREGARLGETVFIQKRMDVMMAVDMVSMVARRAVDHLVLLTGDSDFIPAVAEVRRWGARVSLWHGPDLTSVHRELIDACNASAALSPTIIEECKLRG